MAPALLTAPKRATRMRLPPSAIMPGRVVLEHQANLRPTEPGAIHVGHTDGENADRKPSVAAGFGAEVRPSVSRGTITMVWRITPSVRRASVSYDVIGKMGRVTADITPGHLGEVLIEVRQGTERFLASASDPELTIRKHSQVLVVGSLGGRTVEVAPTDAVRLPR